MMGRVGRFVARKNDETPRNAVGSDIQTTSHAGPERYSPVNDPYVPVPRTRLETKPEHNVSDLASLAKALAARHPLLPELESESQKSKFDDTEFEESTISSIDAIPREQQIDAQHYDQQYGEADDEDQVNPKIEEEDDDDQDHHRPDLYAKALDNLPVGPALDSEMAEARREIQNDPRFFRTQSPSAPKYLHQPIAVRSNSPVPLRNRPTSRPRSPPKIQMAPPPSKPKKTTVVIPPPPPITTYTTHPTTFDKTSSYTDSSANTTPPPPPSTKSGHARDKAKKRPLSDLLDYDPATLKTISFPDLTSQPFDLDPRRPPDSHPSSTSTTDLHHHRQRLTTLKSLSDSDRAKFFASQTKDQWAASTEFFEQRLRELGGELRQARERRREVAVRFEAEVEARMGIVRGRGEGIERCLGGIRGRAGGVLPK